MVGAYPWLGAIRRQAEESHGEQTCKQYPSMASASASDSCLNFCPDFSVEQWNHKPNKPFLCTLLLAMVFVTAVKP